MRKTRRTASRKITSTTLKNIVKNEVKSINENRIRSKRAPNRVPKNTINEAKTLENGQRFFRRYLSVLKEAFVNNGYSEAEARKRAVAYTKKWMQSPSSPKRTRK